VNFLLIPTSSPKDSTVVSLAPTRYFVGMSALEIALEKVRRLDELQAQQLLDWLNGTTPATCPPKSPLGVEAMIGFAKRFHNEPGTAAEWMAELRAAEAD
jgi:hypothetical protein